MKLKNVLIVVVALIMTLSMSVMAFAEEVEPPVDPGDDPTPYQYVSSAYATCSVSAGTARSGAVVYGNAGVTKIAVTYTLQRKSGGSWSNVKSWSKTVNARTFNESSTKAVSSGYSYRTKASVTVYKGAASESFTVYSASVSY